MSRTFPWRRASIAAVVVAAFALAGCAPAAPKAPDAPPLDLAEKVTPVWEVSADLISPIPEVVDDSVLVYEQRGETVFLANYSASDGSEKWAFESSTGSIRTGAGIFPTIVKTADGAFRAGMVTPAVLNEDNRWEHTIRLLDLDTGETVSESPKMWASTLWPCDDALCSGWWNYDTKKWDQARLQADGTFDTAERFNSKTFDDLDAREYHEDLHLTFTEDRWPVDYVVTRDDDTDARIAAKEILGDFHGDPRSLVGGATLIEDAGVFLVSTATEVKDADQGEIHYGGSDFVTFGLDAESGELLWKQTGYVPCDIQKRVFCKGDDLGFVEAKGGYGFELGSGAATVVRLDAKTGEEDWSHESEQVSGIGNFLQDDSVVSPRGTMVFTDAGAPTMVELDTGKAEKLNKGDYVACWEQKTFLSPESSKPNATLVLFDSAYLTRGCGPSGDIEDPAQFTAGVVSGGTQRTLFDGETRDASDQFYVLQAKGKLLAYDLAAR